MTDTILPMVGLNILPLGVVFCAIAVLGLWRAITNYKLMYLTQEIAADHVLVTMKDPVIVTNRKYIIGYMNSAAQTMIGQNASNYIGLPLHTILPELIQAHPCYIALDTYGHSSGNTLEFINSTGIKKPHLCSAVNAYTEFGEKIGVVFVLHDISERIAFERQLQDLNMNLTKKISQINHIFDHVHEGIFTFKEDLIVQEEYSHICYTFFGGPIEQSNVCDLLYPDSDNYEDRDFLKSLLNQLFISNDTDRMRYCPLLPEVVVIEHRILELTFQFTIDTTKTPIVMVILSDATERYALQKQLSLEQQTMEMAVKTLRYHNDFTELVHDYMHFAKNAALQYKEHPATFNRSVHTYRGNFAQFSLINLVRFLQQLEQPLYSVTSLDLSSLSYENLMYHLQIDLDTIEKTTGLSPLVKNDSIQVDTKLLDSLETTIRSITTSPLSEILVSKLNQLHYKSMKALLAPLIEYTLLLAKRHQLVINPFTIQGDDLLIDFKYYQPFLKSLTHLFRNIVGHAIESEDERVQLGKSCCGNVSFTVATDDAYMYITLADDGRGIDYKKVKKIALNSGLLREDMSDSISEIELTNYLVKEYFTTEARHSSTSGLGMGLSEVHQDIMKLQGSLTITSVPTQGTTIKIVLPFTHAIHSNEAV